MRPVLRGPPGGAALPAAGGGDAGRGAAGAGGPAPHQRGEGVNHGLYHVTTTFKLSSRERTYLQIRPNIDEYVNVKSNKFLQTSWDSIASHLEFELECGEAAAERLSSEDREQGDLQEEEQKEEEEEEEEEEWSGWQVGIVVSASLSQIALGSFWLSFN